MAGTKRAEDRVRSVFGAKLAAKPEAEVDREAREVVAKPQVWRDLERSAEAEGKGTTARILAQSERRFGCFGKAESERFTSEQQDGRAHAITRRGMQEGRRGE